jgi:hypothetical protein
VRDAWKEEADAFTPYVGSSTLDASNLMMAIVGHRRRPQDARNDCCDVGGCIATAPTMESTGSPAKRALSCTRWLAQDSRWPIRLIEPRTGCERATAVANDLGLLAEELDPELPSGSATSRKHLVNWPG